MCYKSESFHIQHIIYEFSLLIFKKIGRFYMALIKEAILTPCLPAPSKGLRSCANSLFAFDRCQKGIRYYRYTCTNEYVLYNRTFKKAS